MRKLLISLVLSSALAAPLSAVAAPSNDARSDAMAINGFPFTDDQEVGLASLEPDEPRDCLAEPYVLLSSYASIWYRYTAPANRTLQVTVNRNVGSEGRLGIFRLEGTSLQLLGCSKGWDQNYEGSGNIGTDTAELLLTSEPGAEYLFQVVQLRDGNLLTEFKIQDAPIRDIFITGMSVTKTATGAEIGVDAGSGRQQLVVKACSRAQQESCTQVYRSELERPSGPSEPKHWTVRWDPATCVGDLTVHAVVSNPFGIDPDVSNNIEDAQVSLVAEGLSLCGVWPL